VFGPTETLSYASRLVPSCRCRQQPVLVVMETILSSKSATWYAAGNGDNSVNEITSFDPQSIVCSSSYWQLNVTRTSGSGHFHEHGIDPREERGEEINSTVGRQCRRCLWDIYFCPRGAPKLENLEEIGETCLPSRISKEEKFWIRFDLSGDRGKDIFRNGLNLMESVLMALIAAVRSFNCARTRCVN
jgi:hypothetical protein